MQIRIKQSVVVPSPEAPGLAELLRRLSPRTIRSASICLDRWRAGKLVRIAITI